MWKVCQFSKVKRSKGVRIGCWPRFRCFFFKANAVVLSHPPAAPSKSWNAKALGERSGLHGSKLHLVTLQKLVGVEGGERGFGGEEVRDV